MKELIMLALFILIIIRQVPLRKDELQLVKSGKIILANNF